MLLVTNGLRCSTAYSSVLIQFTDGYFNETMQSTIGVDFKVKVMDAIGADSRPKRVKVTIWDTGRT